MYSSDKKGKGIIVSAPSGAGKTTIVRHLLSQGLDIAFSVSATNRSPREGEVHGDDYYFLSTEDFKKKIKNKDFIEWEEVYENQFYGTLYEDLHRIWDSGKAVIFDVDVMGGLRLKRKLGDQAIAIFIQPPSFDVLAQRLKGRQSDSAEQIERRLAKASEELGMADQFETIIVNDDLSRACEETISLVSKFLNS